MERTDSPLMVTIRCITYNHEPYIRQCLEGFVMQKTNFRFEAIVHDDASTDGTADIIREYAQKYPDIIKPILEDENQYSKHDGSISRILNEHTHGKYVAMCEGDDYWTDPLKLQKQVDFLEAYPEYGLCATNYYRLYQNNGEIVKYSLTDKREITTTDLLHSNKIATLTTVFRTDLMKKYSKEILPIMPRYPLGDYPLWIWISAFSKIRSFSEYTAVYRVLPESASHTSDIDKKFYFFIAGYDIKLFMAKKMKIKYNRVSFFLRRLRFILSFCKAYKKIKYLSYIFKYNIG